MFLLKCCHDGSQQGYVTSMLVRRRGVGLKGDEFPQSDAASSSIVQYAQLREGLLSAVRQPSTLDLHHMALDCIERVRNKNISFSFKRFSKERARPLYRVPALS